MGKIKNTVLEIIHNALVVALIVWVVVVVIVLYQGYRTHFTTVPVITSVSELRENIGGIVEINAPIIESTGVSYTYRARRGYRINVRPTTAYLYALVLDDEAAAVAFRSTLENLNAGETIVVRVRNRADDRVGDELLTRWHRRYSGTREAYLLRRSGVVSRSFYRDIVVHRAGTIDDPMPYIAVLALAGFGMIGMLLWVRKKRKSAHACD